MNPFSDFRRDTIRGFIDYTRTRNYWDVYQDDCRDDAGVLYNLKLAIKDWKARGVVGDISARGNRRQLLDIIQQANVPVLNIGSGETEIPTVVFDNRATGDMGASHLLELGFRHFGFCGLPDVTFSRLKEEGFRQRIEKAGFSCSLYQPDGWVDWVTEITRIERWLKALPLPVAVMACNDHRARQVIWTCNRIGRKCPQEIAILGADNDDLECNLCSPLLSSVATSGQKIGFEAARLLDRLIRRGPAAIGWNPDDPKPVCMVPPTRVVARASTDVTSLSDPDLAAAVRFIRDHAGEPIRVEDVMKVVPISLSTVKRRCLASLGRTPRAEILRVHIEQAKKLLAETNLKISMVARLSGIPCYATFCRQFKKVTGLRPAEFRRRNT